MDFEALLMAARDPESFIRAATVRERLPAIKVGAYSPTVV